jgi:hypothetical protein
MTDKQERENDEDQALLEEAAKNLGEHFESVLILATNTIGVDGQRQGVQFQASSGSAFACDGSAQAYVHKRAGFDQARGFDEYAIANPDPDDED